MRGFYCGYIRVQKHLGPGEGLYRGYIGIMEKKMETTRIIGVIKG